MANVKTSRMSKAEAAELQAKLEQEVTASGDAQIVERDGVKYAVTTSFGMSIETRIS